MHTRNSAVAAIADRTAYDVGIYGIQCSRKRVQHLKKRKKR